MSDLFQPHQRPKENSVAEQAEREAVCADNQAARHELAGECSEALNKTPEGRLQFVCAEAGLSLDEKSPAELLGNKLLKVAFHRPLPMKDGLQARCLEILQAELREEKPVEAAVLDPDVKTIKEASERKKLEQGRTETRVSKKIGVLESSQTEEAKLDKSNKETEQELAVANAVIDDFFQTRVAVGTLGGIRSQIEQELKNNPNIEDVDVAMKSAEAKYIAPHEQRLTAMQAVFTAEEVKSVFGGSLIKTVSLNLRGENKAEIYADVFARIDAGIMDDDRRKEVRAQIQAVIETGDVDIRTGTDYADAMSETRTDADGNEIPVYSENESLKFGIGVEGFPSENGQQQFMRATPENGHGITIDVTNMSPASKGVAASYLGMWKTAEDAGETDFFLDVVQYDIRGQTILDEASLFRAARIMNYTFGGRTGYNGEIVRGNDAVGMMQWQAQLRSPKGDAGRSDNNNSDTRANMQGLAIMDASGNIDEEVLKAFGDYSRDNWFGAPVYEAVQTHLAELFPEKFADFSLVDKAA